jgi:ribose transport system permease protein
MGRSVKPGWKLEEPSDLTTGPSTTPAKSSSAGATLWRAVREVASYRESGVFAALLTLFVVMYAVSPIFRDPYNLNNILSQMAVTSIVGMGQTLVIISGAFDVSQGPMAGLGAMMAALAWQKLGLPPALAIVAGLAVGMAGGAANGVLAARFRLHPIVMTLATATVFTGLNYFITRGNAIIGLPSTIMALGAADIGGVPIQVILMFGVVIAMHLMLTRTLFGLRVRQIGGNLEAARLSGVHIDRTRIGIFVISGFLAALGGIVTIGRAGDADPTIGQSMLFPVITATIIGGTLLTGGVGSMIGTLMGAAILGIIIDALVVLQIDIYLQDVIQGLLVLTALLVDQFRRGELTWARLAGTAS